MKTKTWICLICGLLVVCLALSWWFLLPGEAATAEVWSDGALLYTLDLHIDRTVTVAGVRGINEITVENGKLAVTKADCPDHYCMARGWCSSGMQIVCLPNRLVIRFTAEQEIDGVAG